LIADYFGEELRGLAMGIYNWGIYTGYSLSYALGNFITDANINNQGWRWYKKIYTLTKSSSITCFLPLGHLLLLEFRASSLDSLSY